MKNACYLRMGVCVALLLGGLVTVYGDAAKSLEKAPPEFKKAFHRLGGMTKEFVMDKGKEVGFSAYLPVKVDAFEFWVEAIYNVESKEISVEILLLREMDIEVFDYAIHAKKFDAGTVLTTCTLRNDLARAFLKRIDVDILRQMVDRAVAAGWQSLWEDGAIVQVTEDLDVVVKSRDASGKLQFEAVLKNKDGK